MKRRNGKVEKNSVETINNKKLCYCFNYSKDDFELAIVNGRENELIEEIKGKMKNPGCSCSTMNPSGKCCLGDIDLFIEMKKGKK